jgi:cell division protease FtsH
MKNTAKKPNEKEIKKRLVNEFSKMSGKNVRVMSFSLNPFVIIISIILTSLLLFSLFKPSVDTGRDIEINKFLQNAKNNEYSQIVVQDNRKLIGTGKFIEIVTKPVDYDISDLNSKASKELKISNTENSKLKEVSLGELISKLYYPDLKSSLSSVLFSQDIIEAVVFGDNYIIAYSASDGSSDYIVKNATRKDYDSRIQEQKSSAVKMEYEEIEITWAAKALSIDEFNQRLDGKIYSNIWVFDDKIITQVDKAKISNDYIKLDASFTEDVAQLFSNEGISLQSDNIKFIPRKTSNVDLGLILNILMMVFIGFVVLSILRGINGSGSRLMQFGESKAKVFFGKKPEVTFKDVAGIDEAKEELNEVVLFLKDSKRFMKLGARIPKGLLMVGPPGTGKTLLARAIAGEAGVPFFHTSGSEFEEMLVGAGASRVRDLFAKAKKASPALIFIDEIDAVARKRGTTLQSSSTEQTLNQILVEMDGFEKQTNVIVIAATNRPDVLDPAILRPGRFDRRIVIDLPDIKGREDILKIHAQNKPLAADVDLKKVAKRTVGYSGADLENVLNEAAIIAAKEDKTEINYNDIEEAANRTTMGRERKIQRDKEELMKTAYHEAGHAIVAKLSPKSDPVHRITIVSRGMALGVMMQLPEKDRYSQSYTEMISRLQVMMGGRAAEEMIYGKDNVTSGASNDIEQATKMARRMVKRFGFSDKLGKVAYGESNELQYLGYGYGEQKDYSEETARFIDEEVKQIIEKAYTSAINLLQKNKDTLELISKDLLEKEVIEGEDFEKYFGNIDKPENI